MDGKTDAEKRAYQRGYRNGRSKTEAELAAYQDDYNRRWDQYRVLRAQIAGQIMSGLVQTRWRLGDKQATTLSEYAKMARIGADALMTELGIK